MDKHEKYPTPESNVPKRPHKWTQEEELTCGEQYAKRSPGDWLGGTLGNEIFLNDIVPPEERTSDEEIDRIEFFDSFYRQYPELKRKRR